MQHYYGKGYVVPACKYLASRRTWYLELQWPLSRTQQPPPGQSENLESIEQDKQLVST